MRSRIEIYHFSPENFVMWFQILTAAFLIFLTYFIWSRKHALKLWDRLGIPGPQPNFWFGNAKQLAYGRVNTWEILEGWKAEYGRVFGYYVGLRPTLNVVDAEIVKEIFVRQFSNFVNRPDALQFEENLARLKDDKWKVVRKVMNPIFTTRKLKYLAAMVNSVEKTMLYVLSEKAKKNESIPSYKMAQGLTFQIITKTAFAMDIDSQRNENDPFYENVKSWLAYPFSIFQFLILMFPGLDFLFRFLNSFDTRYKCWSELTTHVNNMISYRRAHPQDKHDKQDLLGLMLEAGEGKMESSRFLVQNMLDDEDDMSKAGNFNISKISPGRKFQMSDKQMVDNLILFLMAGFDSTSNTIAFALHFLAINPEIQDRAYAEILKQIGNTDYISVEETKKLKYLEQIIFETLRLFPPIPIFLQRICAETVTIKGITIPKGAVVECPPWLLHRDPEYWPQPEKFDPDRFAPENRTESQNYAFVPFGTGPRMCLGAKFAMIEAITALAKIIQNFKISAGADFKPILKLRVRNVLLNPAEEIFVTLTKRS